MFDIIILLTGLLDDLALSALLGQHNPGITIRLAKSRADLDSYSPSELRRARLIGFVTPVIVPEHILEGLGFGAYNFHPGPPQYPGWMPSLFAIYDGITQFGATAHKMVARVDSGPIVGVRYFDVDPHGSVVEMERRAYVETAQLFWQLAAALSMQREPLAELPIAWGHRRSTKCLHAQVCEIPSDITPEELSRRIRAFSIGHFGVIPTVTLHGYRFRYVADEGTARPLPM